MFYENIKFQIVASLFLCVMVVSYMKNRKLPLASTRWFKLILTGVCINIIFDIASVYTINHMDVVPLWINRLCHQFFIGSLDMIIMCLFFYISILGNGEQRYTNKAFIIRLLPFALSMLMVLFGNLEYTVTDKGAYSHGMMANTVYFSCAVYAIGAVINTYKYKNNIPCERARSIMEGISLWVIFALIQLFFPYLLISGVALVLVMFVIFLSLENPREFHNMNTDCFNEMAYQKMVNEKFARKQEFYVMSIVVQEFDVVQGNLSREAAEELVKTVASHIQNLTGLRVFNLYDNMLIVFADMEYDQVLERASILASRYEREWDYGYGKSELIPHIDIIACPEYAHDPEELLSVIRYMSEQNSISGLRIVNEKNIISSKRMMQVEEILRDAIDNDGFEMYYQPIYSVENDGFVSAEALIRLKDTTTLGFISPEEFIPIAEKKGLIMQIGSCVFNSVCRFINTEGLTELGVHYIEVNLSGIQCMDAELPAQLQQIMNEYGVSPEQINLEITETATIESGNMLRKTMHKLRKLGCSFSMDDFGTGYSNLSQMAEVKYDLIKIDKSLIWPCFEQNGAKAVIILDNIVKMIRSLGIDIVAEGVETQEQAEKLMDLGVGYLQGYLFSRPINGKEFTQFVKKKNIN